MQLTALGWTHAFQSAFEQLTQAQLTPARVCASQREHYRLWAEDGEYEAELSGSLRHNAAEGDFPVVGDWVAARLQPGQRRATVVRCLPRRSELSRKRAGTAAQAQRIAANLDTVCLVCSLNHDFNVRRIERALALIWESGAQPVLLLSKLDLCDDVQGFLEQAEAVAPGVPVHALSALHGAGLEALAAYLRPARTLALIGSSGVGKSTLLNTLLGETRMATQATLEVDDRGRHTTTTRELFVLPSGALLIDTPGMREFGLLDADAGLASAFDDIEALAQQCRFGDCQHAGEPGCAVRGAVERAELDTERLRGFLKLQRELAYETRRVDERAQLEHRTQMRRVFRERKRALRASVKK